MPVNEKKERNLEVARLYLSGASLTSLATQFNVSKQRIHQVLEQMGVRRRPAGGRRKQGE